MHKVVNNKSHFILQIWYICIMCPLYLTICDLDYIILQGEIQNILKTKAAVDIGEFCLVEDVDSGRWYRGRVQNWKKDLFDVFLIDHGNLLSVDISHISSCSNDLFILPPKLVCGFLANVLLLHGCSHSVVDKYFSNLIKKHVTGYIQALLPHKVFLLEAPDINIDLIRHGFGRHVDTDTFLLLVGMLTEVPLKQNMDPVPDLLIKKPWGQEFCFKSSCLQGYKDILSLCGPRLSCGTRAKVRVTAAVNPGLFYCQKTSMETDLWEMSKMLATVNESRIKERNQKTPENLGLLCSVKGKDGKWYRGYVQFLPVNSQLRVLFIDYGFFESVNVENVYGLPPDLFSTTIMAFPCSLSSLSDEDEAVKTQQLNFLKAGLLGRVLDVEIRGFDKEQHLYSITVIGVEDNNVKEPEPIQELPSMIIESVSKEDLSPQCGYLYNETIMGKQLHCEKVGKTCKIETEKVQAPASFKALNIKPGCNLAVICSYIKSPSEFWCQPLDKHLALKELMDELQQYYSTHSVPLNSRGSCCIAKSPQDGRWYRAFVIEIQKSHARVMLVDYGFTIQIKEQNLEAIMPEYLYLEAQAFRCSLNNPIKPADPENSGDWSPAVCKELKDLVFNSTSALRCEVTQLYVKFQGLYNVVELYDTQTQQSLTNLLFKQSVPREEPISAMQLSTMIPESFVYSSHDLRPGNEEQVYITHVSSQCEIYCHLERNTEMIEELENKISDESEKLMQDSTTAVVRKLSLAKYFDGKWYRGLAHPVQSPLHLGVFFVDYGNTNISEKTHVMCIPRDSDLLYTPMQAVKCHLASVSKEKLCSDVREWLDGAILNKQLRVVVIGKREDGSFDVELFDGDVNISEKVKELILRFSPEPRTVVSFNMSGPKKKPKALITGHTKSSVVCKNQSRRPSRSPTLIASRCTQFGNAPRKKNRPPKKHVPGERPQHTEDTEIHQLSCLPDMKVSSGFRAMCFVSHINSVDSFFLQLSEDEPTILKMGENLNSSIIRDSLKSATFLRVNDLVLAEYEEDGALYRSAVTNYEGSSRFKVEFVDYGNSAVMGKEKIYSIPKEYLSHPRFSIACSLLDTSMYKSDVSFTDAVMEKPLLVDFVRHKNHWEVEVEILDGSGCVPSVLEAAVESEKGEKSPASFQRDEKATSCEQNLFFAPIDIDKAYSGFAAAVTTPCEFCIVLEDLLLVMNKVSLILDDLPEQMSLPVAHLVPGTCCLFKSHTKNKWCRAEIADADTTAVLNLVDYGHYEGIPYEDCSKLKRLPEEMRNLPKVTYPCILRGVKPVGADGQWTDGAAVFFQQSLYQKNLQIFFRECVSNTHWKVDILAEGVHVAKELVDAGHANYIDVMLGLR
uniref:Tudor domain containing 15 n=1 Tax=Cyclopterus lumpus TaxID=8103 RepID=A0A8C2WNE7_CYCLU